MGASLYDTQPENNAKIYLSCIIIPVLNICLCILLEHFVSYKENNLSIPHEYNKTRLEVRNNRQLLPWYG